MEKGLKARAMNAGGPPEGPEEDEARRLRGIVPRMVKAGKGTVAAELPEGPEKDEERLLREIVPRLSKDTATLGRKEADGLEELLPPFDSHKRFSVPRKRK